MNNRKGKLYDVVLIRSFAIVLVVAFHAYGMMYANHFPKVCNMYHDMYYNINQLALKFRMPLFIFISGYLFSYLESVKGKYSTFGILLKNKFKRLIIPYFVFAIVYMLTTKSFAWESLLSGGVAHLWFIAMLFWCFILTRLLSLCNLFRFRNFRIIVLLLSFLLLFCPEIHPRILAFQVLPMWYFWFYLGYLLLPYRERVYSMLCKNKIILLCLGLIWILGTYYTIVFVKTDDYRTVIGELGYLSIVLLVWFVVNWCVSNYSGKWLESSVFKQLNRTSYGIFVLHNWLQLFMISKTSQHLFHLDSLAQNHVILFPLCFFLSSLFLSYLGTIMILKTRAGRFLIG